MIKLILNKGFVLEKDSNKWIEFFKKEKNDSLDILYDKELDYWYFRYLSFSEMGCDYPAYLFAGNLTEENFETIFKACNMHLKPSEHGIFNRR
jgi:predicted HAD superfamily Cof-like phosphohydrolase